MTLNSTLQYRNTLYTLIKKNPLKQIYYFSMFPLVIDYFWIQLFGNAKLFYI